MISLVDIGGASDIAGQIRSCGSQLVIMRNSLEVIGTQLPIAAVTMQALEATRSCFLTGIKVFTILLPVKS